MKHWIPLTLLIFLLAACAPAASPDRGVSSTPEPILPRPTDEVPMNPPANTPPAYLPQVGDGNLDKGNVYIDSAEILILESYPVQIMLSLQGNLPTPCHKLRVDIQPPDEQKRIFVDVYSVSDPNSICAQVLEPFDASIPLGSFPTGHYTVWVNGEKVGEFDA
jgi:hypothetical protein